MSHKDQKILACCIIGTAVGLLIAFVPISILFLVGAVVGIVAALLSVVWAFDVLFGDHDERT